MNYYELLNIPENATAKQIKISFKELILKHHPDKQNINHESISEGLIGNEENIGRNLIEAYQTLNDPSRREEYDKKLRQQKKHTEVGDKYYDTANVERQGEMKICVECGQCEG